MHLSLLINVMKPLVECRKLSIMSLSCYALMWECLHFWCILQYQPDETLRWTLDQLYDTPAWSLQQLQNPEKDKDVKSTQ